MVRDEDVLGRDAGRQALAGRQSGGGFETQPRRAVDLTLYRLSTGRPVDMPSTYDESTDRAYADYPGGTSLERWHRALLRRAMEEQGFTVNPTEWWHFDFNGWQDYAIGNEPFERTR